MKLIFTLPLLFAMSIIYGQSCLNPHPGCSNILTDAASNLANDTGYIPGNGTPQGDDILTVQYRIYVIQKSVNDPQNFVQADEDFIEEIERIMGETFLNVKPPLVDGVVNPNGHPTIADGDTRMRFKRIGCIQYIQDPNAYNTTCNDDWNNLPGVGTWKDNALNVFFVNAPNAPEDGRAVQGANCKPAIFLNSYKQLPPTFIGYEIAGRTFAHEIGHALGLDHPWGFNGKGEFNDIDYLNAYTIWCNPENANTPVCSNNLMAYSHRAEHISPLQAGHMRYNLMNVAPYFIADETIPGSIDISTNTVWDVDMSINQDVVVLSEKTLTIKSCISFTSGTTLYVEKGGSCSQFRLLTA